MPRYSRSLIIGLLVCVAFIVVVPTASSVWREFAPFFRAAETPTQSELFTLDQLDNALQAYEMRYGERPACQSMDEIRRHLTRTFPSPEVLETRLLDAGLTLESLDNRELLVFFLAGYREKDEQLRFPNRVDPNEDTNPLYDFPADQLVDVDNDGWMEFVGASDSQATVYVLTEGHPGLLDSASGATLTLEFIVSQR